MRVFIAKLLAVMVLVFAPFGLLRSQTANITELGSHYTGYGAIKAFESLDRYSYILSTGLLSSGFSLIIYDLADISDPQMLNILNVPLTVQSNYNWYLLIEGQRLAVVSDEALLLYDLADPAQPILLSSRPCTGYAYGGILEGDYLYTLHDHYLRSYNIGNPATIIPADSVYCEDSCSLYKVGDHILVGLCYGAYHIVDASDPANLSEPQNANINSASLCGIWHDRAYFEDQFGVSVYDIHDIYNPIWLHNVSSYWAPFLRGAYVLEGYLVMSVYEELYHDTLDWMEIYDISVDQPVLISAVDTDASDKYFSDASQRILRTSYGKFWFLDFAQDDFISPFIVSLPINSISANSGRAFLGLSSQGVMMVDSQIPGADQRILEIENFRNSSVLGNTLVSSSCHLDEEGYSYTPNMIRIFAVSDPEAPSLESSFICAGYNCPTKDFRFDGNNLMLLSEYGQVAIYDISTASQPVLIGLVDKAIHDTHADIQAGRLYCLSSSDGERYLDTYLIAPAEGLVLVSSLSLESYPRKMDVVQNYLVLATGNAIRIHDISGQIDPVPSTVLEASGIINDFLIKDNAVLVLREGYLDVYSLLPAGQSILIASHAVPDYSKKLALSGNIVLVMADYQVAYLDCSEAFSLAGSLPSINAPAPIYQLAVSPNPFHSDIQILVDPPAAKDPGLEEQTAKLFVYNLRGQRIRTLVHNEALWQLRKFSWDGCDEAGTPCPTGIYLLMLKINGRDNACKKITLIR